jgi:hypothetical protein
MQNMHLAGVAFESDPRGTVRRLSASGVVNFTVTAFAERALPNSTTRDWD